jgi:dTDP-glucose 4,6-dehydratase
VTTLLITGAGGFLGSHVLQAALRQTNDLDVIVVDSFRHNGGTDRILDAMIDVPDTGEILDDTRRRVRLCTHDLAAPFSARQLAELGEVDYVVHAAARCSVDDSIADPVGHVNNNIQSTLTMLELARTLRPSRFLHVSTDEVYGAASVAGHQPSSPYAASKAACEDLCHAYRVTYDVPVSVMNSSNLFGERQSALAFIPRAIRLIEAGETVPIHARAGRSGSRWYTYAPNVARHVVDLLAGESWRWRYPLHGQEEWNVLELATHLATLLGRPLRYETIEADETRPGWDQHYGELPQDSSWRPAIPASTGLKSTVVWALSHPTWLV